MNKFMKHMLALSVVAGVTAGGFVHAAVAQADDWPSRTVRLIVPYGPGASNDLSTRLFANFLSQKFDQTFVVENKPGANGLIIGAIIAFALTLGPLGLALATFIAGFLASSATPRNSIKLAATIALVLTVVCVGLFVYALGLPINVFGSWFTGH